MENHTNKVTALVPAYQAAEFIQDTLDSLSEQTCPDLEVIVSVDLCEDDTYAICARHAENDLRFRVFRQEKRLGYVGNCNFLLDQADSEYALFAFHDDTLAPSYIEKLCRILDEYPEAIMSYSDMLTTNIDGTQAKREFTALDGMANPVRRGLAMLRPVMCWWVPNRGVFRLKSARKIGGLKRHGAGEFSADWPWLFHMSLLGEFVRLPEVLCFKYYQKGSLSRSWGFTKRQYYAVAIACMREIWNSDLSTSAKLTLATFAAMKLLKARLEMLVQATAMNAHSKLTSLKGLSINSPPKT